MKLTRPVLGSGPAVKLPCTPMGASFRDLDLGAGTPVASAAGVFSCGPWGHGAAGGEGFGEEQVDRAVEGPAVGPAERGEGVLDVGGEPQGRRLGPVLSVRLVHGTHGTTSSVVGSTHWGGSPARRSSRSTTPTRSSP